jgi:hypothetical protein
MTTLFDMTFRLAAFMRPLWESEATGGAVTNLVDTLATFGDQHVGGTLFILAGDLANKTLVVTSRTGTTQLNFATQTPNDVAAGNGYILADADFNRGILRRAINQALRQYRPTRAEDTTLTVVADQEVYDLPAGVSNVKEVWLATADSEPYGYQQVFRWDEVGDELRFPCGHTPQTEDMLIKLVYQDAHADLAADSSTLDLEQCPVRVTDELIHWAAAAWLLETSGMPRFHGDPERDMVNKAQVAEAKLAQELRNWHAWQRSARPGG